MRKINNPIPQKIVLTANALKHSPGFALHTNLKVALSYKWLVKDGGCRMAFNGAGK